MLLQTRNLKKHFAIKGKHRVLKAVDGVDLEIESGQTFGLVGESGCGKSTVARTLIKLYEATAGEIYFDGKDVTKVSGSELKEFRSRMQMVFQDPYASLNPRMTVERIITEPLKIHGQGDPAKRRERLMELMDVTGLDRRFARRYPHEFSGGQRQRVGIARALSLNPKFVILDEAVSALDVSIQSQILNLLRDLQEKYALTYLFISHDLSVIDYMCDRIAIMYLGRIVETGSRDDIYENNVHPYTKALLSAIPEMDPESTREQIILSGELPSPSNPPKGCSFVTRCPEARPECSDSMPELKAVSDGHFAACHLR